MAILAMCPACGRRQSLRNKKCKACNEDLDKAKRSRRVAYYVIYRVNGKQVWAPVGSIENLDGYSIDDARAAAAKRKVQKKERRILDMLPETKATFKELTDWHLSQDTVKALAYYKMLKSNLASFNREFGNRLVNEITQLDLKNFRVKRLSEGHRPAYIDKQIESAKNVITAALDNGKIGGDCLRPFRRLKNLCKKGANARDRVLSHQEYESILRNLKPHAQGPFAMAYWSGMRKGEILNLTWNKVDLVNRIIRLEPADTKEKMPKKIPISKPLRSLLMQVPERGRQGLVFTYAGRPVKDISDGLSTACQNSDIAYGRFGENGFIFHDLRHTFTTNARRAGVHKNVAMAIQGHTDGNDMNKRYDTIDELDLINAIDQLEVFLQSVSKSDSKGENVKSK